MKTLIKNYWMMILAWCLLLNGYDSLGIILAMFTCLYALIVLREVNYWRVIAVCMIEFSVSLMFLMSSSIPYYFPKLLTFLTVISLNAAISNEYLTALKRKHLMWFILAIISCMFVLSLLIIILPDELYTMFTKTNLFLMEAYIFLPYLIPTICVYTYKCNRAKILFGNKKRVSLH